MSGIDLALTFNLFEGDYGNNETTILNEIQTAPAAPVCHVCAVKIKPGTQVRRLIETTMDTDEVEGGESLAEYERKRREYFVCTFCCEAARSGDSEELDCRFSVGERRRNKGETK
jgi:hypothetical protein